MLKAFARSAAFVAAMLATAPAVRAQSPGIDPDSISIAALKRVYLACNRAVLDGWLDGAGVMQCSVVYEALKQRAFGGDFDRLLAWSRAQSEAGIARR